MRYQKSNNLPRPPFWKWGWPWDRGFRQTNASFFARDVWPKITVVTPSYNQGKFLEKTIRSVLMQGYQNLEYIVIDGGSTDESKRIIERYAKHFAYWVSEKDNGQSEAINKGLRMASGDIVTWLNSDDYYLPDALENIAKAYMRNPTCGAIVGRGRIVNRRGKTIYSPGSRPVTKESLMRWTFGNDFMQPSCFFTKNAWLNCGPLDVDTHYAMDLDLWLNISQQYEFEIIDDFLSIALSHRSAKTTASKGKMYLDTAAVYIRHGGEQYAQEVLEQLAEEFDRSQWKLHRLEKYTLLGIALTYARNILRKSQGKRMSDPN